MAFLNSAELLDAARYPEPKREIRARAIDAPARAVAMAGLWAAPDSDQAYSSPPEHWDAFVDGDLRVCSFPFDDLSARHPQLSAALLPGLVRSHERAQRLSGSTFMHDIKAIVAAAGAVVLADVWRMGVFASRHGTIRGPDTVRGLKVQAIGPALGRMLAAAGATVVSLPRADIYEAMQYGRLDAVAMSLEDYASLRLFEQAEWLTVPGHNSLCFMYQPVLVSKQAFDRRDESQRDRLLAAGRKVQAAYETEAPRSDQETIEAMREAGVNVAGMTAADYYAWLAVARRSSYANVACNILGGDELISKALSVG